MAVLANPCRDRHEAGTGQLRRPWYFAWALGGRSSGRGSAKHGGEDRAEPDVAPDGAGRQGFSELHVLRPAPQVNVALGGRWHGRFGITFGGRILRVGLLLCAAVAINCSGGGDVEVENPCFFSTGGPDNSGSQKICAVAGEQTVED
jgi:hypothetical protein